MTPSDRRRSAREEDAPSLGQVVRAIEQVDWRDLAQRFPCWTGNEQRIREAVLFEVYARLRHAEAHA